MSWVWLGCVLGVAWVCEVLGAVSWVWLGCVLAWACLGGGLQTAGSGWWSLASAGCRNYCTSFFVSEKQRAQRQGG
eukprot:5249181-Heterocapsa_arctica.AAC.1